MPEIWAVIVGVILLLIVYGLASSKLKAHRLRKAREKYLPFVEDNVRPGVQYNVYSSNGQKFLDVELIGASDAEIGQFVMGGWSGMLILKRKDGKRIFIRQSSVRCIEEL